jgi:hypothetical protein
LGQAWARIVADLVQVWAELRQTWGRLGAGMGPVGTDLGQAWAELGQMWGRRGPGVQEHRLALLFAFVFSTCRASSRRRASPATPRGLRLSCPATILEMIRFPLARPLGQHWGSLEAELRQTWCRLGPNWARVGAELGQHWPRLRPNSGRLGAGSGRIGGRLWNPRPAYAIQANLTFESDANPGQRIPSNTFAGAWKPSGTK